MFYPHTIKGKPNFRDDIEPPTPLLPFYYRKNASLSTSIDVSITSSTYLQVISSTASTSETIVIFHTTKTALTGRNIYIDWEKGPNGANPFHPRVLTLTDGHIQGDNAIFVDGTPASTPIPNTLLARERGDNGRNEDTVAVPDLSSFSDDISILVWTRNNSNFVNINTKLHALQIRELNDDVVEDFTVTGTISETGVDGNSSFGEIVNV